MHVTVDDVNFWDGLKCVYVRYKSCASTHVNRLIITLFLPVKTLLLNSVQNVVLCNNKGYLGHVLEQRRVLEQRSIDVYANSYMEVRSNTFSLCTCDQLTIDNNMFDDNLKEI